VVGIFGGAQRSDKSEFKKCFWTASSKHCEAPKKICIFITPIGELADKDYQTETKKQVAIPVGNSNLFSVNSVFSVMISMGKFISRRSFC